MRTFGVEEEYLLVDAATGEARSVARQVLRRAVDEQLPGLEGLFFLGYSNPITGNIRQVGIDARKSAKRVR